MKSNKVNFYLRKIFILTGIVGVLMVGASCDPEDPKPVVEDPIATFQLEVSPTNPRQVTFSNFSLNATTFAWDFGDGNTSTVKDPVHTFATFGTFTIALTAFNIEGDTAKFSQTIELKDPDAALALLAGTTSKTWRLYREGTSLGVGPDLTNPRGWWSLRNDGSRPCKYLQEFTFFRDGRFVFDDKGSMWGEDGVFPTTLVGTCFAATAANMVNAAGADVSAWLGGRTHAFVYNSVENRITLNGLGAWFGLVKLGTTGDVTVPQSSVSFTASIEQRTGYDLMTVIFQQEARVWSISYASYSNPALEPAVVLTTEPVVDLPLFAPATLFNTFASTDAADVRYLIPSDPDSDVTINIGVVDPANPAAPRVGQYVRGTAQFADLKFPTGFNIEFEGYTSFSIDVYVPSTNQFVNGLTRGIQVWLADRSTTQNFWESWVQYVVPAENVLLDQWQTWTFQLSQPSEGSQGTPLTRDDLDTIGLSIGGSNHTQDGTFFIRNFRFVK